MTNSVNFVTFNYIVKMVISFTPKFYKMQTGEISRFAKENIIFVNSNSLHFVVCT